MRLLALLMALSAAVPGAARNKPKPPAPVPVKISGPAAAWVRGMTLRDKVAQLIMVQFYGDFPNVRSRSYREYVREIAELKVGGLIILNRVRAGVVQRAEPFTMAAFINRMQRLARVPLIVGGDFERGASMRLTGTAPFPHLMAFGAANDLALTRELGAVTAREARALGIQWVFAPVADVNNNPENPVIGERSFGERPDLVAAHVRAFIEGAHSDPKNPVLLCAKHFPGHGDTDVDTHLGLGTITADAARLDAVELAPFRAAIASGVDSVMTAHLAVPALEPEPVPATVSRNILTGLLREKLGFHGLIATDAMDMQGLAKLYAPGEAAVRALEAGADLLLLPVNPTAAVEAVVNAVHQGRLKEARINESLVRVLSAKVKLGLNKRRFVSTDALSEALDTPEDEELAATVSQRAISLVKNDGNAVPLAKDSNACWVTLTGSRLSAMGRDMLDDVRKRNPKSRIYPLDPQVDAAALDKIAAELASCDQVVLAAYVTLPGRYGAFVDKVLAQKPPVILVSFFNPYLLRTYPNVAAYMDTYSTSPPSELAAVRALFGEAPATAVPPVTVR